MDSPVPRTRAIAPTLKKPPARPRSKAVAPLSANSATTTQSPIEEPTRRPRGRPRKTAEELDDGNRRRKLMDGAAKLFRTQGFAATSTRDIAAAAGMHSGSPFYHFESKSALLYAVIGIFHYVFRRRFLAISLDHEGAEAQGLSVRLWDFLFYASFGVMVTRSVSIAGVLLVFCYLIVPSVAAMLYADRIGPRLAIGWTMGTVVSALGIYLSVALDLPTGATMVCTFGLVLILMAMLKPLVFRALGKT